MVNGCCVGSLDIADVKLVNPPKFADCPGSWSAAGICRMVDIDFIHDSHLSAEKGTVRELSSKHRPFAQDKLMSLAV